MIFISPNIGVSAGGVVTLNYDYKVIDWSGGAPTPATFGSIIVSYSNNASGPWQVFDSVGVSNHIPSSTCASKAPTFNRPQEMFMFVLNAFIPQVITIFILMI